MLPNVSKKIVDVQNTRYCGKKNMISNLYFSSSPYIRHRGHGSQYTGLFEPIHHP
jgi:hypothetical protein